MARRCIWSSRSCRWCIAARGNGLPGITNDDSQSFVFDDTNLFSYNRFSGADRQETGLRANIGGRYQANFADGSYFELVAGQSFQLAGPNAYAATDPTLVGLGSGLDVSPSYAVLGAYGSFIDGLDLGGKVQADTAEGRVTRAELGASYAANGFSAGVQYAYIAANPALGVLLDQQQVGAYVGVPVADYWTLTANVYWDITSNQYLQAGGGLVYDDGYLMIGGNATRTGPTHTTPNDTRVTATFAIKAPAGLQFRLFRHARILAAIFAQLTAQAYPRIESGKTMNRRMAMMANSVLGRAAGAMILGLLLTLAAAMPSFAAVLVTVNGTQVTDLQVAQRVKLFSMEGNRTGRQGAIEQLINEAMQMNEAKRLNITVSDAQIDSALQDVARNIKLSQDKLVDMLQSNGVGMDTLRDRLRAAIAWGAITDQAIMPNVQVSDLQLDQQAAGSLADYQKFDYILKEVIFIAPGGQGAGGRTAQANRYRGAFAGCDAAVDLSLSYTDVAVIDVGRRNATQLPEAVAKELAGLNTGGISKPRTVENGRVDAGDLREDAGGRPDLHQGPDAAGSRPRGPDRQGWRISGQSAQAGQDHL